MGRNEKDWNDIKSEDIKTLSKIADKLTGLTARDRACITASSDIAIMALMLSRIADALEEINEKLDKKTDGSYVVYGSNLRIIPCDTGTDDCK